MGERTVYSCDRCGKEVRRKEDLRFFLSELDHDIEKRSSGPRGDIVHGDVCVECGSTLAAALRAAWDAKGAA